MALMMEAARTSETLVNFYQTTRRYSPEDSHLRHLDFHLDGTVLKATLHNSINTFLSVSQILDKKLRKWIYLTYLNKLYKYV
jgi:hypothetical protein